MLRHPVRVTGAARTDTGVHAEHQVATFQTEVPFEALKWQKSLQGLLPKAIGVTSVTASPAEFHPILSAKAKVYRYRLWLDVARHPMIAPYVWELHRPIDLAIMLGEARSFVGTHDYTSFCATDSSAKTRERTVLDVTIDPRGPMLDVWVIGTGFLKQMVRTMVGTLVESGSGRVPPGTVARLLGARDRTAAGITAPAQGLTLVKILYEPPPATATLIAATARGFAWGLS